MKALALTMGKTRAFLMWICGDNLLFYKTILLIFTVITFCFVLLLKYYQS